MEELAFELRSSKRKFMWVIRESEARKVPKGFVEETSVKGFVVSWCPQLEVLAYEAVGCFITHCGWNSTLEALSLGFQWLQCLDGPTKAPMPSTLWMCGKLGSELKLMRKGL
ncbi:putative UDP-glucuronosyl/UDP-glucosyltransferase [Rosa chinensis]|uniref:Putative UDP-glucuronosyl/UDP-glucosyltransferase n=1 Tax=Rosa chinensis TaxID=74649 RepID=A0A2P6PJX7_ROSCH|nr:putative UDP-glucuronosyl/UDP-glucosyltransferase [Rosa chinensis]